MPLWKSNKWNCMNSILFFGLFNVELHCFKLDLIWFCYHVTMQTMQTMQTMHVRPILWILKVSIRKPHQWLYSLNSIRLYTHCHYVESNTGCIQFLGFICGFTKSLFFFFLLNNLLKHLIQFELWQNVFFPSLFLNTISLCNVPIIRSINITITYFNSIWIDCERSECWKSPPILDTNHVYKVRVDDELCLNEIVGR